MKKILLQFGAVAASALLLTGCLEESVPTSIVTESALTSSAKAGEALLQSVSGQMKRYDILGRGFGYDFGIPSMMIARDCLTGDFTHCESGYDWYSAWETNINMGQDYVYAQCMWNTYYKAILAANNGVKAFSAESDDANTLGYRGVSLANRAALYLDMAQMYLWLPNDRTSAVNADGNNIEGLTVPIVTEETTEAECQNNPRASKEEMAAFILKDLNEAEALIGKAARVSKEMPDLAVVYGLKARYFMWLENYPEAAKYARMAITESGATPLTKTEWLDSAAGFNDISISSWLWGLQYSGDENAVKTGILNWTSWQSNETEFGYAGAGPFIVIDANLYKSINDTDFRKLSFKAPAGSALENKEPIVNSDLFANMPEYASLKFRPGSGNISDPKVACAVGVPLMRVEEMYLIEAEAVAHTSATQGKELLEAFVQTYRDPAYVCKATDQEGIIDACFNQKRIELWGEGLIFFDLKRLNKSVTRAYEGSNFQSLSQFNTEGRPAWVNLVITRQESQSNVGVEGFNNPDYSGLY